LFVLFFSLFANVFAANTHLHPKADAADKKSISKNLAYPGFCQIEIINDSYNDVNVLGTFDDGTSINFNVYRYENPHYISLFYYSYCHSGMYLSIASPYGNVYSGWTNVNSSIRIIPYLNKQAKAKITTR
jgi:hypothetical protein